VLSWLQSYLDSRTQSVCCGSSTLDPAIVLFGVPQGSVLGLYTVDLLKLIESYNLHPHAYADDTQIYGFCAPSDSAQLQSQMSV